MLRHHAILLTVAFAVGCAAQDGSQASQSSAGGNCAPRPEMRIVCTTGGAVQGAPEGDLVAYKGIPYAAPPVGDLRWQPPQPATPWDGVRDAGTFGPPCPQLGRGTVVGAEDCLTLNVWTPAQPTADPLPVMIYLTGGGNHSQSGAGNGAVIFTGARLVPQGVLLVTFNFRLGALGFLTHPLLDAESAEGVSGNYGSRDQVAMLKWVQANIAGFGGDPNRVMLFGTSAGGGNICGLMTSPLSEGLFHRAAMESSVPTGCEYATVSQAQERVGMPLSETLTCDTAECLRSKSPEELLIALRAVTNLFPRTYGPVVDGHVFPEQPRKRIREGKAARIPVIIGNTTEEALGWLGQGVDVTDAASYPVAVETLFGAAARDRILAEYPIKDYQNPRAAFVRAATDANFTCRTMGVAHDLVAAEAGPVYRYLFTYPLEGNPDGGVLHTQEHGFFFQWRTYQPRASDEQMSERLVGFWSEFAKTGRPAPEAVWPVVTATSVPYLQLGPERLPNGAADDHCDFWNSVDLPSPHL